MLWFVCLLFFAFPAIARNTIQIKQGANEIIVQRLSVSETITLPPLPEGIVLTDGQIGGLAFGDISILQLPDISTTKLIKLLPWPIVEKKVVAKTLSLSNGKWVIEESAIIANRDSPLIFSFILVICLWPLGLDFVRLSFKYSLMAHSAFWMPILFCVLSPELLFAISSVILASTVVMNFIFCFADLKDCGEHPVMFFLRFFVILITVSINVALTLETFSQNQNLVLQIIAVFLTSLFIGLTPPIYREFVSPLLAKRNR